MAAPYVGPLGMGAWSKYQKYDSSRQALRGIVEQASRKQAVPRPKKRKPAYSQRE